MNCKNLYRYQIISNEFWMEYKFIISIAYFYHIIEWNRKFWKNMKKYLYIDRNSPSCYITLAPLLERAFF